MYLYIVIVAIVVLSLIVLGLFIKNSRRKIKTSVSKKIFIGSSVLSLLVLLSLGTAVVVARPSQAYSQTTAANTQNKPQSPKNAEVKAASSSAQGLGFIAAAIAVGLGSLGAAIAVGMSGAAAVGAVSENRKVFGNAIVFVGLAEGIAIYGLIIAIMILSKV